VGALAGRRIAIVVCCLASLGLGACAPGHGIRGTYVDFIRPDQHPPLVGATAAADSLWGTVAESDRGDGIAESRRAGLEELVRRFTPTIVLPAGDHVRVAGRKYRLLPTDVSLFADTLRLDVVTASPYRYRGPVDIHLPGLTPDSLAGLVRSALRYQSDVDQFAAWYFDFPGANPREWWQEYGKLRTGPDSARWGQPTVYAHPFVDPAGQVVIQYWYFYPFNDFIGNHEGDWEHVNVVLSSDHTQIQGADYFFHARSITLPQGRYRPLSEDGTHLVYYVGGRMYNILDYPIRILGGDRNEGSHGAFPYAGEWEAAGGLGAPESVRQAHGDSSRVISHTRFNVVLTPDPSRIDYERVREALREWAWLILPARFGFPSAPSLASEIKAVDVGNRAPYGAPYNTSWNRRSPTLLYPAYQVRKLSFVRSAFEDLLQPWYYLYIFRSPRYVHDTRGILNRGELERVGLAPRGGWGEKGLGSPIFGVHVGVPSDGLNTLYGNSTGISLWRNFWVKARFGAIEIATGYQKFRRNQGLGGSLFVYPLTASVVVRAPDALFRPYASVGGGVYGWDSRTFTPSGTRELITGWDPGWTAATGLEYYLRTNIAFDVSLRYHATRGPGPRIGLPADRLRFWAVWIGHYVRF
jgi:hypothetical protein